MDQVALDLLAEKPGTCLLNLKTYLARPLTSTLELRVAMVQAELTTLVVGKVDNP
jgi:hypothetical protein